KFSGTVSAEAVSALQSEINTLDSLINVWENKYLQMAALVGENQAPNYLAITEPAQGRAVPLSSQKQKNALTVAFIALALAAGAVALIEFLDNTIKEGDELPRSFGLIHLGSIAKIKGKQPHERLINALDTFDPVVEAYRMIRSNVRYKSVDEPAKSLMVTSPLPGDGKSTSAANLATVMAQSGLKTVLVDADMRRPMQHYLFQVTVLGGLTELLISRERSVSDELVDTSIENLQLLPCGEVPPNPAELLESKRMEEILNQLTEQVDMVVVDSPPTLAVADASVLSRQVSGVILVVRVSKSRRDAIQKAVDRLQESGANLYGGILNGVSRRKGGYSYRYRGYYAAPQAMRSRNQVEKPQQA
ncbi:MAG: CpsD/CapB family tyrosine-protein kinase, partial [Chloroflexota bacterium]